MIQIDLFEHVAAAYAQPQSGRLTNKELYHIVASRAGIPDEVLEQTAPVGRAAAQRSLTKRSIRWHQQSLRSLGLVERVDGKRGIWELTAAGKSKLRKVKDDIAVLGFSTDLGIAIWGNATRVFERWDEPVFLCLTSPPYPIQTARAYGGPTEAEYNDFISRILEPIVRNLVPGGNILINVGQDVFQKGSPARSLYIEKLVIALCERFSLSLMDRLIWNNPNKAPGPIAWASKERMQLNVAFEYVLSIGYGKCSLH